MPTEESGPGHKGAGVFQEIPRRAKVKNRNAPVLMRVKGFQESAEGSKKKRP